MPPDERSQLIAQFRDLVDEGMERYVSLLETMCNIESGSEMVEGVNRVGGALRELGVRMEERVAVLLPDTPEWVYAFLEELERFRNE